jgi:hypothetical protein
MAANDLSAAPCVVDARNYAADTCTARIDAALRDLYARCENAGLIDARTITGTQTLGGLTLGQFSKGQPFSSVKPVTLLLGASTFVITQTLTLLKGSAIVGSVDGNDAPTTTLVAGNGSDLWAIVAIGASWVDEPAGAGVSSTLRDLVIDGNRSEGGTKSDPDAAALLIQGPTGGASLVNVKVRNSSSHGIIARGTDLTTGGAQNLMFRRVSSTNNARAGLYTRFGLDNFIYDSEFSFNQSHGIWADRSGALRVQQSQLSNNWDTGFSSTDGAGNHALVANTIADNGTAGIRSSGGWGHVLIAGNTVSGGTVDARSARSAIELNATRQSLLVANRIDSPADGNGRYRWKAAFELTGSTLPNLVHSSPTERRGTVSQGWFLGTAGVDTFLDNANASLAVPEVVPFLRTPEQPEVSAVGSSNTVDASQQAGDDAGQKIANALALAYAMPCDPCSVDARNLVGVQTIRNPLTIGNGQKRVTLFLGRAWYELHHTVLLAPGAQVVGLPTGGVVNGDFPGSTFRAAPDQQLWSLLAREGGAGGGVFDVLFDGSHLRVDANAAAIIVSDATDVTLSDISVLSSKGSGIIERSTTPCGSSASRNQVTRAIVLDSVHSGFTVENIDNVKVSQVIVNRAQGVGVKAVSAPGLLVTNSDVSSHGALAGFGRGIETAGTSCGTRPGVTSFGNPHFYVTSDFSGHALNANGLTGGLIEANRDGAELSNSAGRFIGNLIQDEPNRMRVAIRTWNSAAPYWTISGNMLAVPTTAGTAMWLAEGDRNVSDNLSVPVH